MPKSWSLSSLFDTAGWLFWLFIFLLLLWPGIFLASKIIYAIYGRWYPIVMGAVLAAVGAGVVSWAVNSVLQRRQKKLRSQARKKARKQR